MTRTIQESNNYRQTITSDGTDTGTVIGSMSATVDTANLSVAISAVLTKGATMPADSVIQTQLADFITSVRTAAGTAGITGFGEATA